MYYVPTLEDREAGGVTIAEEEKGHKMGPWESYRDGKFFRSQCQNNGCEATLIVNPLTTGVSTGTAVVTKCDYGELAPRTLAKTAMAFFDIGTVD